MTANDIKRAVAILEDNGWCKSSGRAYHETYPDLNIGFTYSCIEVYYKGDLIFKHSYPFEYSDILDGIGNKIFDKLL